MQMFKNWCYKNRKDIVLVIFLTIFITIMHGINQSRIHRESAELYWKYVKPYLHQRYVPLATQETLVKKIPQLSQVQHVLTYGEFTESVSLANEIESKLSAESIKVPVPTSLQIELDRYNQTVAYLTKKEEGLLYQFSKKLVKQKDVLPLNLTN